MSTGTVASALRRKVAAASASEVARTAGGVERGGVSRSPFDLIGEQQERLYSLSCRYLGGKKFWHRRLASRSDVHSAIVSGIPFGSLVSLVSQIKGLDEGDVAKVLGVSTRTLRRQSGTPDKPMPADLASKAWLLAETLAKATEIFGGKDEAEHWLARPAMGLDGHRPIELLQTVQGAELVNDFLTRLEYGVYS